jgi:hypothetical protein
MRLHQEKSPREFNEENFYDENPGDGGNEAGVSKFSCQVQQPCER